MPMYVDILANLTRMTFATLGWEILNHPPYCSYLVPSDDHLIGPIKEHLGGQKFKADDKLKYIVLNWLCNPHTLCMLPASMPCHSDSKNMSVLRVSIMKKSNNLVILIMYAFCVKGKSRSTLNRIIGVCYRNPFVSRQCLVEVASSLLSF